MINIKLKNKLPKDIIPVADFHWGFDPGILLMARMCQYAIKEMGIKRGSSSIYACSNMYRCHVDSIQVYLGCTLSSSRLSVNDFGKNSMVVYDAEKDVAKRYFLKAGYPDIFKDFISNLSSEEAGMVMRKIAFSIINLKPEELLSSESININQNFRNSMLKNSLVYIDSNYYENVQNNVDLDKILLTKEETKSMNFFCPKKIKGVNEIILSYIKGYINSLLKDTDRYDIYAIAEGNLLLADAVQVLFGITYGNKHLKLSDSNKDAITIFSHKKMSGLRFYIEEDVLRIDLVKITYKFKKNYFATQRDYCKKCNEIIFDAKGLKIKSENICMECKNNNLKKS